jgi:hypothetical protein
LAREDEERDRLEDVLAACTYSLNWISGVVNLVVFQVLATKICCHKSSHHQLERAVFLSIYAWVLECLSVGQRPV